MSRSLTPYIVLAGLGLAGTVFGPATFDSIKKSIYAPSVKSSQEISIEERFVGMNFSLLDSVAYTTKNNGSRK